MNQKYSSSQLILSIKAKQPELAMSVKEVHFLRDSFCLGALRNINILLFHKRTLKFISPIINYVPCLCFCLSACIYLRRLTKSMYYVGCFTDHWYFPINNYFSFFMGNRRRHTPCWYYDVLKCWLKAIPYVYQSFTYFFGSAQDREALEFFFLHKK